MGNLQERSYMRGVYRSPWPSEAGTPGRGHRSASADGRFDALRLSPFHALTDRRVYE